MVVLLNFVVKSYEISRAKNTFFWQFILSERQFFCNFLVLGKGIFFFLKESNFTNVIRVGERVFMLFWQNLWWWLWEINKMISTWVCWSGSINTARSQGLDQVF
jgi:hypothetical protein